MIVPLPLHSNSSTDLKGNSGKARNRRQWKRILTAVGCCLTVIAIYELSGLGGTSRSHKEKKRRMNKISQHLQQHENDHHTHSRHMKRNHYEKLSEQEQIDLVIAGKVHLMGVEVEDRGLLTRHNESNEDEYEGALTGTFCRLNWSVHKNDPSSYPMFRHLVEASSDCKHPIRLDLYTVIDAVHTFDEESTKGATSGDKAGVRVVDLHNGDTVRALSPSGLVFHESRCGSTLAANSLAAFEPSMNRVYSESSPPIQAARLCGFDGSDCPPGRAARILRDVMLLMGRSDSEYEDEQHLFFKIQSIGTKALRLFREAFPDTPWIFIYREPVQVMMSQLAHGERKANCVRQLHDVPEYNIEMLEQDGMSLDDLSYAEECALHLSLLCDEAVRNLEDDAEGGGRQLGRGVNYENLATKLMDDIIPKHFKIDLTDERRENILEISQTYSKGGGNKKKGNWKSDTEDKERNASPEIREAAGYFLQNSYDWLENEQTSL